MPETQDKMKPLIEKAYDLIGSLDDQDYLSDNVASAVRALQADDSNEQVAQAVASAFFAKTIDLSKAGLSELHPNSIGAARLLDFAHGIAGAMNFETSFPITFAPRCDGFSGPPTTAETIHLTLYYQSESRFVKKCTLTDMVDSIIDWHANSDGKLDEKSGVPVADALAAALRAAADRLDAAKRRQ